MEALLKWLGSVPAEKVGGYLAAVFVSFLTIVGPKLAKAVTARFKKTEKELDTLDEREKERLSSAELFARDAEILRWRRAHDSAIRRNAIQEMHLAVLEEAKHDLEEQIAKHRFERATGKHKLLPPAIVDVTSELESERPKSGAKKLLPPLPTKKK
jgi:hypothetical protein